MEAPLSISLSPLSGRACQTTLSSLFMLAAACQGPSVLICLPIPPISMIFFSTFKSFFHPCSLACLHPFLKKAASCRESRHKLLTFPPPRNSRAILSLPERRRKEGRKRESIWRWVCFLWQPLSRWLMGEQGNQPQGEGERGLWDYLPSAAAARFGKSHKTLHL